MIITQELTNQSGDGSVVSWVDALQASDFVEGAIGGEDGVDVAIERNGCENGVAGVKAGMGLEEVDTAQDVGWLERVQAA